MTDAKQKDELIIDTDSLYEHMKSVESCETKIYACSSGLPTIGVGFALLIENGKKKKWEMREKLFDKNGELDKAGITLPNDTEIKAIKKVLKSIGKKLEDTKLKKKKKMKEINKIITDNSTT